MLFRIIPIQFTQLHEISRLRNTGHDLLLGSAGAFGAWGGEVVEEAAGPAVADVYDGAGEGEGEGADEAFEEDEVEGEEDRYVFHRVEATQEGDCEGHGSESLVCCRECICMGVVGSERVCH